MVIPVVARTDEHLEASGHTLLPVGVTVHKLRHAFASLLIATGYDPATVQQQLGHSDARLTLSADTHQMSRGADPRLKLAALLQ